MTPTSKRIFATLAIGSLLMPGLAFATDGNTQTSRPTDVRQSTSPSPSGDRQGSGDRNSANNVCTRYATLETRVDSETSKRHDTLKTNFGQRDAKLDQSVADAAQKLAASRAAWDAKRDAQFVKLVASAQNDAQRQAILAFETTVKAAVIKRRAAVDAANTAYHTAVKAAVDQRQNTLTGSAGTYQTAVAAAFAAAKASCAAGMSPATVGTTLKSSLDAARANLKASGDKVVRVRPNLDPYKTARQTAVDAANTEFRATISTALTTLKAALKAAAPSPSATPTPSPSATP